MKYHIFFPLLIFSGCTNAQKNAVQVRSKSVSATNTSNVSMALPTEIGDFRMDMLTVVNFIRAKGCKCGGKTMATVPPLKWDSKLEQAAINHANDMAKHNRLDHVSSDGSEIDNRADKVGYKWMELGENIAFGQQTLQQVTMDWLKSTSHCKQLMSNKITEMGAARNGKYWVQDYGKKRTW
jgi:uncharacterized protein YkwD